MMFKRVDRVIGRTHNLDTVFSHKAARRHAGVITQHVVAPVVYLSGCFRVECLIDTERGL